ncbi:hypothetical protein [Bradyrhizobium sp. ERR14]|uniref:hypothetical protein n=1 Tax=Bradyrhizobium sp. ERR14 TaxID=2663837 RepID=UPI0016228A76|nr:hypothetical protein [Bradyrhizobium sp. ERR14]MBB4398708.1 hypothetical protein [Bradyrhizobium sp. ERR14]
MKATSMLRLFTNLATGGFALALAIDSSLNGHSLMAALFTTAAMVLLLYGWFELKAQTATKSDTDILRNNIDTLIKLNAQRSAEAATFMHALITLREALRSAMGRDGMIEIVEDSLAEVSDPATGASFCLDLLNTMGVPLYPLVKARQDEASQFDDEMFNRGVSHTVDLLAKTLEAEGWVHGDGSEDYDCDLAQTFMNIMKAKGLYEDEYGTWATLPAMLGGKAA